MHLHEKQREIAQNQSQFKVIRAGRKGGKTAFEVESISYKATAPIKTLNLSRTDIKNRKVLYIAPTQKQARTIIWEALKTRLAGVGEPKESLLEMKLPTADGTNSTIYILGWENRENARGFFDVTHITFDEVDTMKDFFISFSEIFYPMILDTNASMDFIGTPKKENPNLRRLEKEAENKTNWSTFHFTSKDNPHISQDALATITADMDKTTYKQEILAEHVEDAGALFRYTSLVDMFSNTVTKTGQKYLIVDIADDGSDKTVFSFWEDLECYRIEQFEGLNTETIINQIREYAADQRIPYSHICVDAIGVGAGVASSSYLNGIIGFKSSYGAIRTDQDIVRLPNVHYTKDAPLVSEYRNLRCQCVFTLAQKVNNHDIACKVEDVRIREKIIEELALYQDVTVGDTRRVATPKEDIVALLGRSPDLSDTFIMRMYFELRAKVQTHSTEEKARVFSELQQQFQVNESNQHLNNTR